MYFFIRRKVYVEMHPMQAGFGRFFALQPAAFTALSNSVTSPRVHPS